MASQLRTEFLVLLIKTISLICQTLFNGVYFALMPFSVHFLLKKKTMSRGNKLMFSVTVFMFLLSTAFWATSVGNLISTLDIFFSSTPERLTVWTNLFTLFNSLILMNYVLTDSVVVWRAWVLCKDGGKGLLMVPLVFLMCTFLSVIATIAIRVTIIASGTKLDQIIDTTQLTNLVLSLLTNISATSIIGFRAWRHRREIRATLSREHDTSSKVEKILTLLVESGLIYCVSGLLVLLASLVRLPHGTLGDIYTPIHVQIAGIYPTVILVLVSRKRSLKEGAFSTTLGVEVSGNARSQIGSMNFRSNPAFAISTIIHDEDSGDNYENSSDAEHHSEAEMKYTLVGPRKHEEL